MVVEQEVDWFSDYRPTRLQMVPIKFRQLYFRNKTSWPYISGDSFARLAQIHVTPGNFHNNLHSRIARANIIFIDSTVFGEFLDVYIKDVQNDTVILTGNGDFDVTEIPNEFLSRNINWFAQNLMIPENQLVSVIPAGIENIDFGRNGMPRLFQRPKDRSKLSSKILFGPFGDTHPQRREFLHHALRQSEIFSVPRHRVEPGEFARIANNHRFVFCPRGNGFDSHRFWETLYRGAYPIVEESIWASNIEALGLPVVTVSSFYEITSEFLAEISSKYPKFFDPLDFESLWMPFWDRKIQSKLVSKD